MRLALTALLLLTALPAAAATPTKADADRWWGHVAELADDKYEGRFTGTAAYQRAADYVAKEFKALGLKPAGTQGFMQPVQFREQTVDADKSRVALTGPGGATPLAVGPDILPGSRVTHRPTVDAPLVFIGYGIHLPDAGHDDFAGLDLKGKVVVYLNGGPANLSAALKSHARAAEFWPALERAGAIGAISIANPKSMDIPWERSILLNKSPGMFLADPALRDQKTPLFTASINPASADRLFAPSGRNFADLLALVDKGEALPRFDLGQRVQASVTANERDVTSPNVVAMLPGADPKRRNEYVVLTAHLDHIGIGEPINGDTIHNGAMDNASGIASLIESARAMAKKPPARSVIFLAVTAEERGLLGSRYYASRPTVPASAIAANVNMDMYLPLWPLTHVTALGEGESNLGPVFVTAAKSNGLVVSPDPEPDRNLFVRSDQYSFVRKGVPALALKFASSTPEQDALMKTWLKNRYHAPSDDLAQPVDMMAAARFNIFLADLIRQVANMESRPAWNADSFFTRFAPAGSAAPVAGGGSQ